MRLTPEELTANIDDDFKMVIDKLQGTFNYMAARTQMGRSTHTYGAVAKGEARCIVPSDFPENDCFVLGKRYSIVLRHSSPGGRADDRAARWRCGLDQVLRRRCFDRRRRLLRHSDECRPPAFRALDPRLQHLRAHARRRPRQAGAAGPDAGSRN
ncbi:MAG: hypothetical protein WDN48_18875 [Pseudolabrys sp.]